MKSKHFLKYANRCDRFIHYHRLYAHARVRARDVYNGDIRDICRQRDFMNIDNDEFAGSKCRFSDELDKRGFRRTRLGHEGKRGFQGIGLKNQCIQEQII